MPISGVAITFEQDAARAILARDALGQERRIELGPQNGNRIAATIETESQQEDRQLRDWISALPGVVHVDIAFIELDDGLSTSAEHLRQSSS